MKSLIRLGRVSRETKVNQVATSPDLANSQRIGFCSAAGSPPNDCVEVFDFGVTRVSASAVSSTCTSATPTCSPL
jgi:hypothetical protein